MIVIRAATEDDLPAILAIYNEVIATTTAVYDYEPHTLEMRRAWFQAKKSRASRYLLQKKRAVYWG